MPGAKEVIIAKVAEEAVPSIIEGLAPLLNMIVPMILLMVMLPVLGLLGSLTKRGPFGEPYGEFWSESTGRNTYFPSGSVLAISDGQAFGGRITFIHYGEAATARVGFWCDIDGYQSWAGPVEVELDDDTRQEKTYTVDVEGVFQKRGLSHCRRVRVVMVIMVGDTVAKQGDAAECYHVVTDLSFDSLVCEYGAGSLPYQPVGTTGIEIMHGSVLRSRMSFRHKGAPAIVTPVVAVGPRPTYMLGTEQPLGYDADWKEYTVELMAVAFDAAGIPYGSLDCLKVLQDEGGGVLASDWDRDTYKLVTYPAAQFKDLTASYQNYSRDPSRSYSAGSKVDIAEGDWFRAFIEFKHKGIGGQVGCFVVLDVNGVQVWAGRWDVILTDAMDWREYQVDTDPMVFYAYGLAPCRNINLVKVILSQADGSTLISDPDADCYHVIA